MNFAVEKNINKYNKDIQAHKKILITGSKTTFKFKFKFGPIVLLDR